MKIEVKSDGQGRSWLGGEAEAKAERERGRRETERVQRHCIGSGEEETRG